MERERGEGENDKRGKSGGNHLFVCWGKQSMREGMSDPSETKRKKVWKGKEKRRGRKDANLHEACGHHCKGGREERILQKARWRSEKYAGGSEGKGGKRIEKGSSLNSSGKKGSREKDPNCVAASRAKGEGDSTREVWRTKTEIPQLNKGKDAIRSKSKRKRGGGGGREKGLGERGTKGRVLRSVVIIGRRAERTV